MEWRQRISSIIKDGGLVNLNADSVGALEILGHHLLALPLGLFLEEAPADAVHVVLATPVQELAHALVGIRSLCGRARE